MGYPLRGVADPGGERWGRAVEMLRPMVSRPYRRFSPPGKESPSMPLLCFQHGAAGLDRIVAA
jgi:hypothetical protein